jgi:hypothetical protein
MASFAENWRKHYLMGEFGKERTPMTVEAERIDVGGEAEISEKTKRFVKAELKRADVTYDELARRLSKMGIRETKVSIASKLSRGAFSATFFVAVMKAIDRRTLSLEEI